MGKARRLIVLTIVVVFGLSSMALIGCGGSTPSADTPETAVKGLFAAAAKGDADGMKKYLTGKALKGMPKPGSKGYEMVKTFGAALKSVEDVKIKGDKATATVKLDADAMKKLIMKKAKAMIDKIKDPKMKAKMLEQIKKQAAKMSKFPVALVKEGGKWKVSKMMNK